MAERGAIRVETAYALGKMLDHSAWQKGEKIARLSTPSDIDTVFDNGGKILFCEFSATHSEWCKLHLGQRLLYENCIKGGTHMAALCKHNVTLAAARPIDTRRDVESFQLMIYAHKILYLPVVKKDAPDRWDRFVRSWFDDPVSTMMACMEKAFSR